MNADPHIATAVVCLFAALTAMAFYGILCLPDRPRDDDSNDKDDNSHPPVIFPPF